MAPLTSPPATVPVVVPQHLRALTRANEVRLARSEVKRRLRDGEVGLEEAIADPCMQTATVFDLLTARRRWGRRRALRVLGQVPVRETKEVGSLTDRQRAELLLLAR